MIALVLDWLTFACACSGAVGFIGVVAFLVSKIDPEFASFMNEGMVKVMITPRWSMQGNAFLHGRTSATQMSIPLSLIYRCPFCIWPPLHDTPCLHLDLVHSPAQHKQISVCLREA